MNDQIDPNLTAQQVAEYEIGLQSAMMQRIVAGTPVMCGFTACLNTLEFIVASTSEETRIQAAAYLHDVAGRMEQPQPQVKGH